MWIKMVCEVGMNQWVMKKPSHRWLGTCAAPSPRPFSTNPLRLRLKRPGTQNRGLGQNNMGVKKKRGPPLDRKLLEAYTSTSCYVTWTNRNTGR